MSTNTSGNFTLTGGTYGFYPQVKTTGFSSPNNDGEVQIFFGAPSATYATNIYLKADTEGANPTILAQNRYLTASGKDPWLFILWDNVVKEIISASYASDHPSYGQEGDETVIPHPFADYHNRPLPANLEIILIDNAAMPALLAKRSRSRTMLTIVNKEYEVDETTPATYISREIIEPDEWGDRAGVRVGGSDKLPLKRRMVNTLPAVIKYRKLKKKV